MLWLLALAAVVEVLEDSLVAVFVDAAGGGAVFVTLGESGLVNFVRDEILFSAGRFLGAL